MIRASDLSTRAPDEKFSLGVLSVHLEGGRCRVGCEFCYLGARQEAPAPLDLELLAGTVERLGWDELAVAVSEPVAAALPALERLGGIAQARGRRLTVTTTLAIAGAHPEIAEGVGRLNLSVDPRKGPVDPARLSTLSARLKARAPALDLVLIVTLIDPAFASRLVEGGLLEALVDLPAVDKVALNAIKPPPPWCDRAFWLRALDRLRPLCARALDSRLFLDCYVAARLLGLGPCPARADLSPAPGGLAFRGCVYQPAAEWVTADPDDAAARLAAFQAPAACPFEIR